MPYKVRPYAPDDAPALFEAATESIDSVYPWLPWCHPGYRIEEARGWVEQQVAAFPKGEGYEFVIVSRDGRFTGGCGVNLVDRAHLRANLGYWVRASEARRGAATDAARAAADWAFRNTDLVRLEIVAAVENVASQRVAEKTGAVREGVARRRLFLHGRHHDAVVFSLVRPGEDG